MRKVRVTIRVDIADWCFGFRVYGDYGMLCVQFGIFNICFHFGSV